jgi:predicted transcriptional regulator
MNKKRNDMEILAEILSVAKYGARKSHIVYKANLNFEIIKNYLYRLEEAGLITGPNGKERVFNTTEKGIKYLGHFEEFKNYMNV